MTEDDDRKEKAGEAFVQALEGELASLGRELADKGDEARQFTADRITHLSTLTGQAGYDRALIAERNAVALRLASIAVDSADATDQRILGFVGTLLVTAAAAIAPG